MRNIVTDGMSGKTLERLDVHDHLCLLYETKNEQFAEVVPFFRLGLERGEKCIYIADDNPVEAVHEALAEGGIDVKGAVASGALFIASKRDAYLRDGYFDPDRMIAFLDESTSLAEEEGFAALRGAAEMTWALGNDPGVGRLMEYESRLNHFFSTHNMVAICQYNIRRFPQKLVRDAILTHPLVISKGQICRNFYYVPPDEFQQPGRDALEVERFVRNILKREQAEETLRESEASLWQLGVLLNESQRVGQIGSWDWDAVSDTIWWSDEFVRMHDGDGHGPALTYEDHLKFYTRESAARLDAAVQLVVKVGGSYELDLELQKPSSTVRWILARGEAKRDENGSICGLRGTVLNITERKLVEAELLDKQHQVQSMAMDVVFAAERERSRIAGELHDHIGQSLLLCKMKYDSLIGRFADDPSWSEFAAVGKMMEQTMEDLRRLNFQLSPPILASAGLEAALRWLGEELRETHGLSVEVAADGNPKPLGPEARSVLFQASRELLLNVAKHAGSTQATVSVERLLQSVVVTVADSGVGFEPLTIAGKQSKSGGYGLFNVQQRVEYLGGRIIIDAERGRGTRISIVMPLDLAPKKGKSNERFGVAGGRPSHSSPGAAISAAARTGHPDRC